MKNNRIMSEKYKKEFALEWERTCKSINNQKSTNDINDKHNLHGIFRRYSEIKTSSGVRYGKIL